MRKLFFLLSMLLSASCFSQNKIIKLYYENDQSELTDNHRNQLLQSLKEIPVEKIYTIRIVGHTDRKASITYNQLLSQKRADQAANFFLSNGIDQSLLALSYLGESKTTLTSELQFDRKVEIEILYHLTKSDSPPIIIPIVTEKETITDTSKIIDLWNLLKSKPQEFCINPRTDTILRCAKGTLIHIKAGSFKLKSNLAKNDCIRFQVKEAYSKSDMILENLTTISNGNILETQGMVYTNAMVGNDTLSLSKDITIMMPTDSIVGEAGIFDGQRNAHDDVMNWSVNNNSVLRNFSVTNLNDCLKYNDLWRNCNQPGQRIIVDPISQQARCNKTLKDYIIKNHCKRCKLGCRLKRVAKPIKGIFNKKTRFENKKLRKCQKIYRNKKTISLKKIMMFCNFVTRERSRGGGRKSIKLTEKEKYIKTLSDAIAKTDSLITTNQIEQKVLNKCEELDALFKTYGVDNTSDLVRAVNKPLMDEFNVNTMEALLDTLPKANMENIEIAYRNKKISFEDYKFYIFNASNLGWKNVDVFADIKEEDETTVKIKVIPTEQVDCKLVFKKRAFTLPAKLANDHFYFEGIPKGEEAWIVGIKYENGRPFLGMRIIIVEEQSYQLVFEELPLEKLKEQLTILDFD